MKRKVRIIACALLLSGCDKAPPATEGFAGLGQATATYTPVVRGQALSFPADHGAHAGYRIEWWYVTANLTDEQGHDWGVQWTLFRSALRPGAEVPGWSSPTVWLGHAALSSASSHQYSQTLARGGIGQAGVDAYPFRAWIDDWSLASTAGQGLDQLQMRATGNGFSYRLQLISQGPLVLHGDRGYSEKSGQGQASYYYSQPFYQVSGEVERHGQRYPVTGRAWLDREWSSQPLSNTQQGWDWFSLHLENGAKLMLFQVRQRDGQPYRAGTWISPDGHAEPLRSEQIQLDPQAWTRQDNGKQLPTRWRLQVATHNLDVQVAALQPHAWMGTTIAYWEGPVQLLGSNTGRGYLEMTGY